MDIPDVTPPLWAKDYAEDAGALLEARAAGDPERWEAVFAPYQPHVLRRDPRVLVVCLVAALLGFAEEVADVNGFDLEAVLVGDHEKCRGLITKSALPRSQHRPLLRAGHRVGVTAHPVALALDVDHRGVVQEPVQDRRSDDLIGEHGSPVGEPAVGGEHDRATLVAA